MRDENPPDGAPGVLPVGDGSTSIEEDLITEWREGKDKVVERRKGGPCEEVRIPHHRLLWSKMQFGSFTSYYGQQVEVEVFKNFYCTSHGDAHKSSWEAKCRHACGMDGGVRDKLHDVKCRIRREHS